MYVLGVIGPAEADTTELIERLVDRLDERGRVATVKQPTDESDTGTIGRDAARYRGAGATTVYGLDDTGRWFGAGDDFSLADVLDRLAPDYNYAILDGFDADMPGIVLGGVDYLGSTLIEAETADDVDVDRAVDALAETEPYVILETLIEQVKESPHADRAGAIATFTGRVRTKDADDDAPTELLEFETYEGIAEQRLIDLREELEARDGIYEVRMHHRTGVIESGEDIVFVVVLAGHRGEAFRTVEDGIDRLKDEVPIFKKEVTSDEEFWVHTRD